MQRCPGGEGLCDIWDANAAADFETRSLACRDCQTCEGRAPLQPGEESDDVSESFLQYVENLYYEQLAGRKISPANLTNETWTALVAWHKAEKRFERRTSVNLDLLIQSLRQQQK